MKGREEFLTQRLADRGEELERSRAEIERLTDAIWKYGEHRKSCRIVAGKECDCGFFEVIKSLQQDCTCAAKRASTGDICPRCGGTVTHQQRVEQK